jgi:hypothetical protein
VKEVLEISFDTFALHVGQRRSDGSVMRCDSSKTPHFGHSYS